MTNTTADTRSTAVRRFVRRTLGASTVLLTLGLAAAPAASAVGDCSPTPPVRMYPMSIL